jgi:hypothetical protein
MFIISLVGWVVIGAELGMEDHGLIPRNYDGRGLEPLDARTDPRTRFNWWWKQKKSIFIKLKDQFEKEKKKIKNQSVTNK